LGPTAWWRPRSGWRSRRSRRCTATFPSITHLARPTRGRGNTRKTWRRACLRQPWESSSTPTRTGTSASSSSRCRAKSCAPPTSRNPQSGTKTGCGPPLSPPLFLSPTTTSPITKIKITNNNCEFLILNFELLGEFKVLNSKFTIENLKLFYSGEIRDADADAVEKQERHCQEDLGDDVGRREDRRQQEDHNQGVAELADEQAVVDQADARQEVGENGQFKDEPEGQNQIGGKREVFADPDGRPNPDGLVAAEKESEAGAKDRLVAKPRPEKKEQGTEQNEAAGVSPLVLVEAVGDEPPGLPEEDGGSEEKRGDEGDLELGKKGLGNPRADQDKAGALKAQQGIGEKGIDRLHIGKAKREGGGQRQERFDQTGAQLPEMAGEGHARVSVIHHNNSF